MNKYELIKAIENRLEMYPERMTGNEINPQIASWLKKFIDSDRVALIEALRDYLYYKSPMIENRHEIIIQSIREARLWMALDIAESLKLTELKPDIELLLANIQSGKLLKPVHESGVIRCLKEL
jgi:hypothetical protein